MQSISPTAPGRWRSRSLATMVAASALLLGACIEDFSEPDPEGPVTDVLVSTIPLNQAMEELFIGTTRQLLAGPRNEDGRYVPGQSVTWSSSNEGVVSISQDGLATAVSSGNAVISATAGGVTGTTEMKVRFPVGQVAVTPAAGTIRREGAIQLTANVTDQGGTVRTNRAVTWASLNPAVATVSASGLVSGITDGQAVITATSEGVSGQATITVFGSPVVATVTVTPTGTGTHAIGQTRQFTAVAKAGSGTVIGDAVITWASTNAAAVTVTQTGLATVVGSGSATITASVNEITGTVTGSSTLAGNASVTLLATGGPTPVPVVGENAVFFYVVSIPAGTTSFTVSTAGGAGDSDMYILAPTTSLPGAAPSASTGQFADATWICRPWNVGSNESCTINTPVVGNYVVAIHAYPGEGPVTGMMITHTRTP